MIVGRLLPICLADAQPTSSRIKASEAQQISMEQAFLMDDNLIEGIEEYFFQRREVEHDCCEWRGAVCTDGVLTTLALAGHIHTSRRVDPVHAWRMRLPWLPHTIEYFHAPAVYFFDVFNIEQLPRCLRYFHINDALYMSSVFMKPSSVLNLENLPKGLEELWLMSTTALFGTVLIPILPPKIRIFVLRSTSLCAAVIHNSGIPSSLEFAILNGDWNSQVKMRCVDAKRADARVLNGERHVDLFSERLQLGKDAKRLSQEIQREFR